MKIKRIILGLFCLLYSVSPFAANSQHLVKNSDKSERHNPVDNLHALFSYTDFKFNASDSTRISRFQGHYNLYLLGGNSKPISQDTVAGLFAYKIDTYLNFTQSSLAFTAEAIHNNSLFGHVLKRIKNSFSVDLMGAFGQNRISYKTLSTQNTTTDNNLGHARSHGNSWFVALKGFYTHSWDDFVLLTSVGALHTEVIQKEFNFFFTSAPTNFISPLTSSTTFLLENAELTYKPNSIIIPFVNAGLIQVVQKLNNRPLAAALSIGSTPNQDIALNKNGFSVGAGLALHYKKMSLRLEQQYYQRGTIYHSNQSILSFRIAID